MLLSIKPYRGIDDDDRSMVRMASFDTCRSDNRRKPTLQSILCFIKDHPNAVDGEKILDRVLDNVMAHGVIDFPRVFADADSASAECMWNSWVDTYGMAATIFRKSSAVPYYVSRACVESGRFPTCFQIASLTRVAGDNIQSPAAAPVADAAAHRLAIF